MTDRGSEDTGPHFFVSYTQTDRAWAEWIAWTVEEAGYQVLIQAWDVAPGSNWVTRMQDGVTRAARTIAVLSDAYARSVYGAAEWQAAWAADPDGQTRKLLVVRVADCARPGLVNQIVAVDVFGLDETGARTELLRAARLAVSGGRAKPDNPPPFPPNLRAVPLQPSFPGRPSGSLALSKAEIQALASAFPTPVSARQILDAAGVGVGRQPMWNLGSPEEFWSEVSSLFAAGVLVAGRERLLAAAYRKFPANPVFAANSSMTMEDVGDQDRRKAGKWLEDLADLKRAEGLIDESLKIEFQRRILSSRFGGHTVGGAG